jgi:YD repeat-containing protein
MNPWNHRRTRYEYNSSGQLKRLIVENPATGTQQTVWEYGVTLAESAMASNDLVRRKVYPDSAGGSDVVSFRYNRQGQVTRVTDQNGTVREFNYDGAGADGAGSGDNAL